ncbi:MAG: adenine nucleotide alpha hydrolase [Telmatospirillum sp.]|nr:adenine nucleotide alpha hydrolase [Telmatospirillum sp.]
MVLTYLAHRFSRAQVVAVHGVSPAVPAEATRRVDAYASREGWTLHKIDAGEMTDPDYRRNPVNRCFHCKSNLYAAIQAVSGGAVASGTNQDDLGDFRPGLEAARRFGVVHPFVEAGLRKSDIYALARRHGLTDLAALPAQPCLASRIETGLFVDPDGLAFIEQVETELGSLLPSAQPLRCRLTARGVFIECGRIPEGAEADQVRETVESLCLRSGRSFQGLRPYRQGSAFLRTSAQ